MSQKIYVGNLSFQITNDDLKNKFAQYGNVNTANIIRDRETNRSKGFGFVEMDSQEEATDAISALHGSEYEGRAMTVNEAKPMVKR